MLHVLNKIRAVGLFVEFRHPWKLIACRYDPEMVRIVPVISTTPYVSGKYESEWKMGGSFNRHGKFSLQT